MTDNSGLRVTAEEMTAQIKDTRYLRDGTMTIAIIELYNGFKAVGSSACIDPAMFDAQLGMDIAYRDAFGKLWPMFGFHKMQARREGWL